MADYNFDSNESHWDHFSNESNWNEAQWRNYLKLQKRIQHAFYPFTIRLKIRLTRRSASLMGWDGEDISLIDEDSNANHSEA